MDNSRKAFLKKIADLQTAFKLKRQSEGLSLRDLEPIIGVSYATIGRFENAAHRPTKEVLKRIAAWVESDQKSKKIEWNKRSAWNKLSYRITRIEKHLGLDPL